MQARGKTCFLQQQEVLLNQNSRKVPQKKATAESGCAQKSVEKARGRTCFLQQVKNTTDLKLRKRAPKMQPQMKHTNTTTNPKSNFAPRDDDTRCRPRPLTSFCRPEALAWWLTTFDQWKQQIPYCKPGKCNHAS